MTFVSTRGFSDPSLTFADVIIQGLAPDGGLFIPSKFPSVSLEWITTLQPLSYPQRVVKVLSLFEIGISEEDLLQMAKEAYEYFESSEVAPVKMLNEKNAILELFHGPTASFKDMALQLTPKLFSSAQVKKGNIDKICVLTATSGDTGIAAIEGFKNIPNVSVVVLYPKGGVSALQEQQMRSVSEKNVKVIAVESDFDFCQTTVKKIFADESLNTTLQQKNIRFTAANSMNWGRLLPQVVYYFSAYADLLNKNAITFGEQIEVCVPSGNFGNLLAAYIAGLMGLPISKYVVASNENNVLANFFNTGTYSIAEKLLLPTDSPSIDILISSNIERFLFLMNGRNAEQIKNWYQALATEKSFDITAELLEKIQSQFEAGYTVHEEMQATIQSILAGHNYLLDPHTAVAVHVAEQIPQKAFRLIASTAHYQKFAPAMARIFGWDKENIPEIFSKLAALQSSVPAHSALSELINKPLVQNTEVKGEYDAIVREIIGFL